MNTLDRIREPIVEGIFYPAEKGELERAIDGYLSAAAVSRTDGVAIVSPHAGYTFCGECIGESFSSARDREISTVVILSPVHREPADEIFLTESGQYRTPAGNIRVATDAVRELESCSTRIIRNDIPHLEEHAIEVQLPFVLRVFPRASIVPILLGRSSISNARILARGLESVFGTSYDHVLFVVSSNLCANCDRERAISEIALLERLIEAQDPEEIIARYHRKEITACGAGCIAVLLMLELPKFDVIFHTQRNSADASRRRVDSATYYGALTLHAVLQEA